MPELNPYAAPLLTGGDAPERWSLAIPAMCLLVLSTISATIWLIAGLVQIFYTAPAGIADDSVGAGVANLFVGIIHAAIGWGAYKMFHRQSLTASWAAAVVASIPIVSPLVILGIPFGIWAVVLLCRSKVRDKFRLPNPRLNPLA
jgi:hypothetical protein